MSSPLAYNTFALEGVTKDSDGRAIQIAADADTLLNDVNTVGEAKAYVYTKDNSPTPNYVTTNDGTSDIVLNGVNCFATSTNGNKFYYTVRGGLPAGTYVQLLVYRVKNGEGQWNERLSTKEEQFTVVAEKVNISA